jgi:putative photosynthetic complex assembly protein
MRPEFIETDAAPDIRIPRPLLVGAAGLALVALAAAALGRRDAPERASAEPAPSATRALLFEDSPDGAVLVRDAGTRALVARVAVGEGGFLRGSLRGLARGRRRAGVGPEVPFVLVRSGDGRLTLHDSSTASRVDLMAFGPTNEAAFARLLEPAPVATR